MGKHTKRPVNAAGKKPIPPRRRLPASVGQSYDLKVLREQLKPFRLYWFTRLSSTNSHAMILRRRKQLYAPAVILTGHQAKGRGRGSNSWWSGKGSMTATFVLPIEDHLQPHQIPLIAGLATRNAVAELSGVHDIGLKWPNDLLHDGKKLAGLLCERIDQVDLIGIGLNVNVTTSVVPKSLRDRVTSLQTITGQVISLSDVVVAIARNLRLMLSRNDQPSFGPLLKEYDRHHMLVGRSVRVISQPAEAPLIGKVTGLDSVGRLLVRSAGKSHAVIAGSIEILKSQ